MKKFFATLLVVVALGVFGCQPKKEPVAPVAPENATEPADDAAPVEPAAPADTDAPADGEADTVTP